MIILDTNILSEIMRPKPDQAVVRWVTDVAGDELWTTAITVAEIRYGIERLPYGSRKLEISATAERAFGLVRDRVLAFDAAAAREYALLVAERGRAAKPIDGFDGQIAAICRCHGASLATRNVKDFPGTGIELLDPWQRPPTASLSGHNARAGA